MCRRIVFVAGSGVTVAGWGGGWWLVVVVAVMVAAVVPVLFRDVRLGRSAMGLASSSTRRRAEQGQLETREEQGFYRRRLGGEAAEENIACVGGDKSDPMATTNAGALQPSDKDGRPAAARGRVRPLIGGRPADHGHQAPAGDTRVGRRALAWARPSSGVGVGNVLGDGLARASISNATLHRHRTHTHRCASRDSEGDLPT